ncbi:MAG: hypothetical protein RR482_03945, partial [Clostridia bacterium]
MLHHTGDTDDTLLRRNAVIQVFQDDATCRAHVRSILHRLGRNPYHGACAYLFHPSSKHPEHIGGFALLAVIPFVFLFMGFVHPTFLLGVAGMFAINAVVYYLFGKKWMAEIVSVRHIAAVLKTAGRLSNALPPERVMLQSEMKALCLEMKPIARWNALFAMQRQSEFDFLTDYVRIMLQLDMLCLGRLTVFMGKHNEALRRLYRLVGEVDVDQAMATYRACGKTLCKPEFLPDLRVVAQGLTHPLITSPVPNDIDWNRCVLLTGSNASGKSTFIKAMAINAILAQSVLTCTAERFGLPRVRVMTSMALRDSVKDGESYFVVEIKSLKRIADALGEETPTLCFIDEILRGTNTVERIAASSVLLDYMNGKNGLCMAATHDQELTEMLPEFRQMHFREEMTADGMTFSYKILEGASNTRNAIALLAQMDFPEEVVQGAKNAAARFDAERRWR